MNFDDLDLKQLRRRRGEKWQTYPPDVLAAWVADMDFPVAPPLQRMFADTLANSDFGYPLDMTPAGLPSVFARRMAELRGWQIDPARCEVILDVVQALYIALEVHSEPGDGAITTVPIYPPFLSAIRETERRAVHCPLRPGASHYELDLDALRAAVDARTKLLLLCHPQNPTGRRFTRAELQALAELVLERDLIVFSDEIHQDLVLDGGGHVPFAMLGPEIAARTITVTSATKAFNIAGLRCAVAHFGSRELHEAFNRVPRHVRGGLNALGLEATRVAWTECQEWLAALVAHLQGNRDLVAEFVRKEWPAVRHFPPQATYLAWLDCRALELPDGPYRFFLERARVALSDGRRFGPGGEGFVRLNFATSRALLQEILARMADALRKPR
jgi:cysteine-S-conjugate beta-lyase